MALIQVFKHGTDTQLGKGDGSVDKKAQTATITSWTVQPAVVVNVQYKLKSGGKIYPDAQCIQSALPAQFDNVV